MIVVKTPEQIDRMRRAGNLVAQTLDLVEQAALPGTKTATLDALAEEFIRSQGAEPAFKGYMDYPATLCVSIDDEVVHGIPGERRLKEGQIVSIDVGVRDGGWYADAARTVRVGAVSPAAIRLLTVTQEALRRGIEVARPGNRLGDISAAVQTYAEENGYSVVRELVGHGIGQKMHEEPQIPNFGRPRSGPELKRGMVLAIEPMVNAGRAEVRFDADKWTVRTVDGSLSAHFEHTVAITDAGPDILTQVD
ncbi:MAG: type I methionyl aminopeptidase [candidate division Zixibacteria bacterium]|nr:type I methionyl aminopeptidase [candidate division Zixibacteria bacterium]